MEIDAIKSFWLKHDKNLSESLKMNKALLQKANLESTKKELSKPLNYEISSLILFIILIIVFMAITMMNLNQMQYLITGVILNITLVIGLILCIQKLKLFYSIDYYNTPIIKLQEHIALLKSKIFSSRKIEILLAPVMFVTSIILLFWHLHQINIFDRMTFYIPIIIIGLMATFIGIYFVNKYLYDKKIKNVEQLLLELDQFMHN